jgi:GH24 family phage-related lysozyme (muramidase)
MFHRRDFLMTLAFCVGTPMLPTRALGQTNKLAAFDALLQSAIENENLISAGRELRERQIQEYDYYVSKAAAPRKGRSSRPISERAIKLIMSFEVTSEQAYARKYQGVTWPKGASGVTIGIGYDVGYVTRTWLHEDWDGLIDPGQASSLEKACETTGARANALLPQLATVNIPWTPAYQQFRERTIPLYVAETMSALPNCDKLSDDSLGALVSLVYNRGASFQNAGSRYQEMRAVRQHMAQGQFKLVANDLHAMKRVWKGNPAMRGLLVRRDLEAQLFEAGLA